eukprot:7128580-Lingulodinium_polyedra.AAC.1
MLYRWGLWAGRSISSGIVRARASAIPGDAGDGSDAPAFDGLGVVGARRAAGEVDSCCGCWQRP